MFLRFLSVFLCIYAVTVPSTGWSLHNLGNVTTNIYRGGALSIEDYQALKDLNIQTVINLQVTPDDKEMCTLHNLECLHFPLMTIPLFGDRFNFSLFYEALKTVLQKKSGNSGVYIHCYHGSDRTGLLSSAVMIHEALQEELYQNEIVIQKIADAMTKHHFHQSFYPNLEIMILSWARNPPIWLKNIPVHPAHTSTWVEAVLNSITPFAVWLTNFEVEPELDALEQICFETQQP